MNPTKIIATCMLSSLLFAPAFNFAAEKASPSVEHVARNHKADVTTTVNINEADAKILTTLKDIGPKKAEAIVAFRTKNGNFKTVDDLLQVPGISKRILKDNENRITLS